MAFDAINISTDCCAVCDDTWVAGGESLCEIVLIKWNDNRLRTYDRQLELLWLTYVHVSTRQDRPELEIISGNT